MMTPMTLVIDRTFRGVGRIKKATGTTVPALKRKMSKMLTELHDNGRIDILRAIRDNDLTILDVWGAYQRKALHELPVGETIPLLSTALNTWIESLRIPVEASKHHVAQLHVTRCYFERENPKARVSDLPKVLEALRNSVGKDHPRSFNLARSGALAFVRQTMKRNHPLYLAVAAVEVRKVEKSKNRKPASVQLMRNIFPNPESDPVDAIAWGMATTGMRNNEYFGKWEVQADRIHVIGTKRAASVRDVPLVRVPAVPSMHRRTFENKLRERTDALKPYDFRRTFANWLEAAGVPRTRRRMYMGHGASDVTDLYEWHEVEKYLAEDAAKIRAFLGLTHTKTHTIQLVEEETA